MNSRFDSNFDFRTDTPPGKDPDSFSPTLREYHRLLWSKPLPSGKVFELVKTSPQVYLHHQSELGEFFMASNTVVPSFWRDTKTADIIAQIPADEIEYFNTIGYSIGGMMIFPGNRVAGKMTINQARGFHPRIKDRFDYTVECIRRYYLGIDSPLSETLMRYSDFFALFEDFRGYVEFFLLQDLVTENGSAIKFFSPFDAFESSPPLPSSKEAYIDYKKRAIKFIVSRNQRILRWDAAR